jgi:hypothetical protein
MCTRTLAGAPWLWSCGANDARPFSGRRCSCSRLLLDYTYRDGLSWFVPRNPGELRCLATSLWRTPPAASASSIPAPSLLRRQDPAQSARPTPAANEQSRPRRLGHANIRLPPARMLAPTPAALNTSPDRARSPHLQDHLQGRAGHHVAPAAAMPVAASL